MVVNVYLRGTDWVKDYLANVPPMLRNYGGEYLAVSKTVQRFEGDDPVPDQVALLTFPSLAAMNEFIDSEEYAPYKQARMAQSSAQIFGFET
jgi:uncharacterized protein (DUF1330 family)